MSARERCRLHPPWPWASPGHSKGVRAVNERILIIDDDAVVRQVARAALERDGYIVHCAADGALPKPFSPLELVARVKALLRRAGGRVNARDLLAFAGGRLEIDTVRHEVRVDGAPRDVTPSEYDLLLVLSQYPGRVYSRGEIAYGLRGHDFEGDERVVDVHVRNLRRKVEVD